MKLKFQLEDLYNSLQIFSMHRQSHDMMIPASLHHAFMDLQSAPYAIFVISEVSYIMVISVRDCCVFVYHVVSCQQLTYVVIMCIDALKISKDMLAFA